MKLTVNSIDSLLTAVNTLEGEYSEHKYIQLSINAGKKRTADQNRTIYRLYEVIARKGKEHTPETAKQFCKLHCGVPILRSEDEDFCADYDAVIKPLSYENKLKAMNILPVTSLMNTNQLARYIDDIIRTFAEQKGINLAAYIDKIEG